jgi:hypothetical protein
MCCCWSAGCTLVCRLAVVPLSVPAVYNAEVKIRDHTNHTQKRSNYLWYLSLVPLASPNGSYSLTYAVKLFIDRWYVEGNPKATPKSIMLSLLEHETFANLPFLTENDTREDTTWTKVRNYRRNATRAKPVANNSLSVLDISAYTSAHQLYVPPAITIDYLRPYTTWPTFEMFYTKYKVAYNATHPLPSSAVLTRLLGRKLTDLERLRVERKETINEGSAESLVAAPPAIDTIADEEK